MKPLTEAQAQLLAMAPAPRLVGVPLSASLGRILMADVTALRDQPSANLSAMDGYAVSAARNASGPWDVVGTSSAGRPFVGAFPTESAVRIFTGAVMPIGADTVIVQENIINENNIIRLIPDVIVEGNRNVRAKAGEFATGAVVVPACTRINAATIGLIAAAGHAQVTVCANVKIAIIATGDELVRPGVVTDISQIPSTNDVMLSALLARPGVQISDPVIVPDDLGETCRALSGARGADIIITIGGASVGDHDLVRPALVSLSADIAFWKVAMKPGKPVMAGRIGDQIVIGLPGNPVSAYVTALLFAAPLIAKLLGEPNPLPRIEPATLGADLPDNQARTDHIRGCHSQAGVVPLGVNDSGAMTALAKADCLIVRQPFAPRAKTGEIVDIIKLT